MTEKYTGLDSFSVENLPLYMDVAKNGCVVAFDTETTGLHNHDDIVQLAWVVMEKGVVTRRDFTYIQNLSVPLNGTEAQQVNGLTDEMLARSGRHPKEVYGKFRFMLEELAGKYDGRNIVLVAHNLPFDLRMLYNNAIRYYPAAELMFSNMRKYAVGCDTKEFVKSLNLPTSILPSNHLRNCISAFALDAKNSHDALDDTDACLQVFNYLTKEDQSVTQP